MTDDISKVDYDELHVTHSAGEIAEMLRQSDAQCATLARQLAEAKERGDNLDTMATYWHEANRQAESQLAEATRRLGEVEGLLRECQRRLGAEESLRHMTYREWSELDDRIDAALTKEPTK